MKNIKSLILTAGSFLLIPAMANSAYAQSCKAQLMAAGLNGNVKLPTLSEVNRMSLTDLKKRQVVFNAKAQDEATAISEAKQRIAESILNRVAVKNLERSDTVGDNLEGAITKTSLISSIEAETLLDVQLPQPEVQSCTENGKDYTQAIYTINLAQLAAPSIKSTRNFQDNYKNYLKNRRSASGISSLLKSYPLISSLSKRSPVYNRAALRILKIRKPLPAETAVRRRVNSVLRGIRLNFKPARPVLNPLETLDGFQFEKPEELTFSYRKQPIINLDLTLKIGSKNSAYQAHKTDKEGQIKLSRLMIKKSAVSAVKKNFVKNYCPKISISLGARDQILELSNAQQVELRSFNFKCNSFSYVDFQKAKKADKVEAYTAFLAEYPKTPETKKAEKLLLEKLKQTANYDIIYKFIEDYPTSQLVEKAENILYTLVAKIDSKEMYSSFLSDFPKSKKRSLVINRLFSKVKQENTWDAYWEFAKEYPDSSRKKSAVSELSRIAMGMAEGDLGEKEDKLSSLEKVAQLSSGKNSSTISRLKREIDALRKKALENPITEDVRVLKMRSVANPDYYASVRLDITKIGQSRIAGSNIEIGRGFKQVGSIVIGGNYDGKWKQSFREAYADAQFRIYGKLANRISLAVGAVGTWRSDNVELDDQRSSQPNGTDEDGDSQFVNTKSEAELYLTSIFKLPAYSTYFHLYAGTLNASAAAQYFVLPEVSVVAEGFYRHADFNIDSRSGDTTANENYKEREDEADNQKYDGMIGVKVGTPIEGLSGIQSKIFYSTLDEKVYLNFSGNF